MTATTRLIRPKTGLTVRDPIDGSPLPAHGRGVVWSSFWQRRFDDGDVVETDQKAIDAAEKRAAAAAQPVSEKDA